MSGDSPKTRGVPIVPPTGWWWEWRDDGRVVVWSDLETTIAFREELAGIVDSFPADAPPAPGTILHLLAACRDDWQAQPTRDVLHRWVSRCGGEGVEHGEAADLVGALGRVRALPEDLRRSATARATLVTMVVEKWRAIAPTGASRSRPSDLSGQPALATLRQEWRPLLVGLDGLDEASLRTRIATGLDALPAAADPDTLLIPPVAAPRGVPEDLLDHPETAAVASLALEVMAAVSLPRRLDVSLDRPEGGVADIVNKGSPDRLLLSELAHDDSVFATRVALGEALYLRRELSAPPPPHGRTVLLDSGVRMWGVPRAYAAAVALALRAQTGPAGSTTVFRASRAGLVPVDLATKEGLIEHLGALEILPHPGAALAAFAAATPPAADAVLVTCEEALADDEFCRLAADCPLDVLHVVTVARDGRLRILARSRRGTRLVRAAVLDAEAILMADRSTKTFRPAAGALFDPATHELPAIFAVEPFPLRLAPPVALERTWGVEGVGVFMFTEDGRLLLWDDPALGARQIAAGLPRGGRLLACEPRESSGRTLAVVGKLRPGGIHALSIDCRAFRVETATLDVTGSASDIGNTPAAGIQCVAGRILVRHRGRLLQFDPLSGALESSCDVPRGGRQIGRIVQGVAGGATIALAAGPAGFVEVAPEGGIWAARNALSVFETVGGGDVTIVESASRLKTGSPHRDVVIAHGLEPPIHVAGVSRDGRRFSLEGKWPGSGTVRRGWRIIEVASGNPIGDIRPTFDPRDLEKAMLEGIRHEAVAPLATDAACVALGDEGTLIVSAGDSREWTLIRGAHGPRWRLTGANVSRPWRRFGRADGRSRHALRSVRFRDGTMIWCDPRHLLHLRSSVRTLPEVTLVSPHDIRLGGDDASGSAAVAGWASDGRVFGTRSFHGREPTDDVAVFDEILRPLVAAIRE